MLKLVIAILFTLTSATSFAKAPLINFGAGSPTLPSLPFNFTIVNWNIYKAGKDGMAHDLSLLTRNADVAILQEMYETPEIMREISTANQSFAWSMVQGFKYKGHNTGVATGSRVATTRVEGFLTTVREPILNSPKSMLLTVYPIANSLDSLAVLNVHAINFVLNSVYKKQIAQMIGILKDHRGPIVVAGDFNTWNNGRMSALDEGFASIGLKRLKLEEKNGSGGSAYKGLDHAYVRGLIALEATLENGIKSSDHRPIVLKLQTPQAANSFQVAN